MFDAFSYRELQNLRAVVSVAMGAGISSVAELDRALDKAAVQGIVPKAMKKQLCPDCGAPMMPARKVNGLELQGCPQCRKSVIV